MALRWGRLHDVLFPVKLEIMLRVDLESLLF